MSTIIHKALMNRFCADWRETNLEPLPGYGADRYCQSAKEKIRLACKSPAADVFFLTGGTQANAVVIAALLDSFEGVIAADTGHISVHEAGAIERTGHKVLTLPHHEGKICAAGLETFLCRFWKDGNREHMVFPGMVYLSHPTEYGTLYSKEELEAISTVCRAYQIPLYLDGARLGYGLASPQTDVTLPDIAAYCDAFYIGGTKGWSVMRGSSGLSPRQCAQAFCDDCETAGSTAGQRPAAGDSVRYAVYRPAVLAHWGAGNRNGPKAGKGAGGYGLPILSQIADQPAVCDPGKPADGAAGRQVSFSFWETLDENHTVVRFATSWATRPEEIEALREILAKEA